LPFLNSFPDFLLLERVCEEQFLFFSSFTTPFSCWGTPEVGENKREKEKRINFCTTAAFATKLTQRMQKPKAKGATQIILKMDSKKRNILSSFHFDNEPLQPLRIIARTVWRTQTEPALNLTWFPT
jgi:hypothetical protein